MALDETNPPREPQYRIVGGQPKGATVTIPGIDPSDLANLPKVMVRLADGTMVSKSTLSLERIFRSAKERELGRDFTPDEVDAEKLASERKYAEFRIEQATKAIDGKLTSIAASLERAAAEMRQLAESESYGPPEKVMSAQHTLAWLYPNLGADQMSREAMRWIEAQMTLGESPRI